MSLNYDMRKLDIDNIREWRKRKEYDTYYDNGTLFDALVIRLMVLRPSNDGRITPDNVKTLILRSTVCERVAGGMHIPPAFIRRMIGLETNVFPAYTDSKFVESLTLILFEDADRQLSEEYSDWHHFN